MTSKKWLELHRRKFMMGLWGFFTTNLLAINNVGAQNILSGKIIITDKTGDGIQISANDDFAGNEAKFVDEPGDGVEVNVDLDTDAVTTFESLLLISNQNDEDITFELEGLEDTGPEISIIGPDGSIIGGPAGTELAPNSSIPLTVIFDLTAQDDAINVNLDLTEHGREENGGGGGGGASCSITTATYSHPATLHSLRRFRDGSLSQNLGGTTLVKLYYILSPPVAKTLEDYPRSKTTTIVRRFVKTAAMLANLKNLTDRVIISHVLTILITLIYCIGGLSGIAGHISIKLKEKLSTLI